MNTDDIESMEKVFPEQVLLYQFLQVEDVLFTNNGVFLQQAEADQSRDDADLQELIQLESRFHHTLYAATGNVKLEELLIEFLAVSSRLWHSVFFTKAHLGKMFKDQRNILKALKNRDGKRSAELLVNHTQSYFGPLEGLENR